MHKVIWPQRRTLTDQQVIDAAADSYFNNADAYRCNTCGRDAKVECECDHAEVSPIYSDGTKLPDTVEDAREWLSDMGEFTFAR